MNTTINSNEIKIRKIALKTAYDKELISLHQFKQELARLNYIEERISEIELKKQNTIKQAKKKINKFLATI